MAETGVVDSTEALGAAASELLGDFSGGSEMPDQTEAPETGTPSPSESPADSDAPPTPEGESPVEPTSEPSSDAPADDALDEPDAPVDPETAFQTEPALTYTVDGVEKSTDAVRIVDGAGYIPPSKLAEVQRKLGERDHLYDANQKLYEKQRTLDAALSYNVGPKDKQTTLTGVDAFRQAAIDAASGTAAGLYLMQQFNALFPNPTKEQAEGLKQIFTRAAEIMENTTIREGQRFGTTMQERQRTLAASDANAGLPTIDQKLDESFGAIRAWAQKEGKIITEANYAEAKELFGNLKAGLVKTASAEDAKRLGIPVGAAWFDPAPLNAFFLRVSAANAANKVAQDAGKANQNRIAGAIPRKPAKPAPARPKERPADQRAQDASDAWDLRERLAMGRLQGTT